MPTTQRRLSEAVIRATKEGGVHQAVGSDGFGYGIRRLLQPPAAAQCSVYRTPAEFAASCEPSGADEDLMKEIELVTARS